MQIIKTYLNNCNRLFQTGNGREHSYRGHLETLLNEIINDITIEVVNEPARIVNVGAPDYSITRKDIPIGYVEAKDVGAQDLDGKKINKEQFDRYKNALDNLIITDYLDFLFYKNGELVQKISIAKIKEGVITPIEDNFSSFTNSIKDFTTFVSQTITSPSKLAKLMAGKARLLENVIEMICQPYIILIIKRAMQQFQFVFNFLHNNKCFHFHFIFVSYNYSTKFNNDN